MKRHSFLFFAAVILVSAGALFAGTDEVKQPAKLPPTNDPKEILRRLVDAQDKDQKLQNQYTYQQHVVIKKMEKEEGLTIEQDEVADVLPLYGETYERTVMKNGQPLSAKDAEKEEEKINKFIEKHKKETDADRAKRAEQKKKDDEEGRKFLEEGLRAYDFTLLPDEEVDGRAVWHIKAEPRGDFKPQTKFGKYLPKFRGSMWIDKDEYQIVKIDAEALDTVSYGLFLLRVHKGTHLEMTQTRVNDEVWLPKNIHFFADVRAAVFLSAKVDGDLQYSNYRKYKTESKILPGVAEVSDAAPPAPKNESPAPPPHR
jgi:hypothetical protein